jgi:hypothetical protein
MTKAKHPAIPLTLYSVTRWASQGVSEEKEIVGCPASVIVISSAMLSVDTAGQISMAKTAAASVQHLFVQTAPNVNLNVSL